MDQVTIRIRSLLRLADSHVEKKEFSESSTILRYVLEASSALLDQNSLRVCLSKLGQSLFREALVGNTTWDSLVWHYRNWSLTEDLSPSDQFNLNMALANVNNLHKRTEDGGARMGASAPRPYVLRFHLPQHAQTPSLAHFGHVYLFSPLLSSLTLSRRCSTRCGPSP
jgi:hypothetical protein